MSSTERSYFLTAVEAILNNWTALQLAINQNAAGSNSRAIGTWMSGAIVSWFEENKNVEFYEATELLETILNQEFNLIVQDGSGDEIGRLICDFYSLIFVQKSNEENIINRLKSLPKCDLSRCKIEDSDSSNPILEERNDDSMECDSSSKPSKALNNQPDEDGWITVPSRSKK